MNRRAFIAGLGGAAAWPLVARARRPGIVRRVVVVMGTADTPATRGWLGSFSQRLDELGWQEGSNLFTQVRWWNDRPQQMKTWAVELMAGSPDVAITVTSPALEVMKRSVVLLLLG